jgi:hypothetical protein
MTNIIEIPDSLLQASAEAVKLYAIIASHDTQDGFIARFDAPQLAGFDGGETAFVKAITELGLRGYVHARRKPLAGEPEGTWFACGYDGHDGITKADAWFGMLFMAEAAFSTVEQIEHANLLGLDADDDLVWVSYDFVEELGSEAAAEKFLSWLEELGWVESVEDRSKIWKYRLTIPEWATSDPHLVAPFPAAS